MKRKALMVVVAASVCLLCQAASPQGSAPVPGKAVCCREGVSNVPEGQECVILHEVGPGESLYLLSAYYYGDARAWRRIYEVNKKHIRNPNKILVGQVLRVAVDPCWSARFDLKEFLQLEKKRKELLRGERAPQRIIKTKETVETKVRITVEEEEGEEAAEEAPEEESGTGPGPSIQIQPAEE